MSFIPDSHSVDEEEGLMVAVSLLTEGLLNCQGLLPTSKLVECQGRG